MPELTVYQQPDFPAVHKWQAIAFMRMEWASIFYDDNLYMSETYPPELQPVHFVIAKDDSLPSGCDPLHPANWPPLGSRCTSGQCRRCTSLQGAP